MIATSAAGFAIASVLCLTLAARALAARKVSFEHKAVMAVAWILVIAVLAFILTRIGV